MRGLPAGLAMIQPIDQKPYTSAAIAQTSANTSAYDMSSPQSGESACYPGRPFPHAAARSVPLVPAMPLSARLEAGAGARTHENALFCQRPVQEVEPVLAPEKLVAIDVGGCTEHLALDRLVGERLVAHRDVVARRALVKFRSVEAKRSRDFGKRGFVRDVALLRPDRTSDRASQGQSLRSVVFFGRENPVRRTIAVDREEARLAVHRDPEIF